MNALATQKTNGKSNIIFFRIESNPIHETLLNIGLPPHLNGFVYIAYSLELILENPEMLQHVTKGLYIDVAKNFKTKPTSVERAIRHAITITYLHGNLDYMGHIFQNYIRPNKSIPSNTLFLAGLYHHIRNMKYE